MRDKDYVIDKIVDGIGGDSVKQTSRKIAGRVGIVLSALLTVIVSGCSVIAIIVTLIVGGNVIIPATVSSAMIIIIWVGVAVTVRIIAAKIANTIGGGVVTGAVQSIASEIARTISLSLTAIAGVFAVAAIIVTLIAGGNVIVPIVISVIVLGIIWVAINALAKIIAVRVSKTIIDKISKTI